MINYSNYLSKSPTLNEGVIPNDMIRSVFDYGVRQRRGLKKYRVYSARLILRHSELQSFYMFVDSIKSYGNKFYFGATIMGDTNETKIVRQVGDIKITEIGNSKFEVLFNIEILSDVVVDTTVYIMTDGGDQIVSDSGSIIVADIT